MDVTISRDNLPRFQHSLAMMQKISKELVLEYLPGSIENGPPTLNFRVVNDAKSAFALVEFRGGGGESFFTDFSSSNNGTPHSFVCKLNIKPFLAILKNIKRVSSMRLVSSLSEETVDQATQRLVVILDSDWGLRRIHRLVYQDCTVLTAVFDITPSPELSYFYCDPSIVSQLLHHIHRVNVGQEIAWKITRDTFSVRTYASSVGSGGRIGNRLATGMASEMTLGTNQFEWYTINIIYYF